MRILPAALAALVLCTACGDTTAPNSAERLELSRQRVRWRAAGVHHYVFDYTLNTPLLAPGANPPVQITVLGDTVAHVIDLDTGAELSRSPDRHWPTVDSLFVHAGVALSDENLTVRIEYDPRLGFPESIAVSSTRIADVNWSERVSGLAQLR